MLFIAIFCLQDLHFFSKTSTGERFEYFKTETSVVLPQILASYLYNSQVKYSIYKIPNYIKEFLTYNKDFSISYKNKKKYTVIIIKPYDSISKDENVFIPFYNRVKSLVAEYSKSFNLIVKEENTTSKYLTKTDNVAYNDLKTYCLSFCLIDPTNDTMFVFNRISNSTLDALEVLFQQYHYKNR